MIIITVPGIPVPKARPRVNHKTGAIYTPKKSKDYEAKIKAEAQKEIKEPLRGPISMRIYFRFPKPKKYKGDSGWYDLRQDIDNLVKSVMDALNGIAYKDDKQVTDLAAVKAWIDDSEPVTDIYIKQLSR